MNIEQLRGYALSKPGTEESFPFGEETLVFKVNNKIFLLAGLNVTPLRFNVKCEPERALELREECSSIQPGYHMNKKHWNTIIVDGSLSNKQLEEQVDNSYKLVAGKKKK